MSDTENSTFAPTGEPDRREEWLAALLLIGLGDLDAADQLWRSHVSTNFGGMLDGTEGFTFDPQRQMYVTRHGKVIGGADLKRIAVTFNGAVDHDMRRAASDMAVGLLTIGEWQRKQAELTKDLYLANAALSAGGFANLTDDLKQAALGKPDDPPGLAFTLNRLQQFAEDVAAGAERNDSEAAVMNRASLYASSANGVFENVKRESHRGAADALGRQQFLYEMNVLGPAEQHCVDDKLTRGCVEVTDAGWQPIGTLPLPGLRSCGPNCLCEMTYSLTSGAFENN